MWSSMFFYNTLCSRLRCISKHLFFMNNLLQKTLSYYHWRFNLNSAGRKPFLTFLSRHLLAFSCICHLFCHWSSLSRFISVNVHTTLPSRTFCTGVRMFIKPCSLGTDRNYTKYAFKRLRGTLPKHRTTLHHATLSIT